MNYERLEEVKIAPLESGFIVTRAFRDEYDECDRHRTAEPTLYGAITLAARALGYRGLIRFESEPRTVEVPIVGQPFDAPEVFDDEVPLNHGTAVDDRL